ncbi:TetR/AcrR family transcriptional regulator [Nocardia sp. XZ_19_385]|uniref:TetR/AcrR family transcriptional regulator n=1 Tax=Nocardia sp. XZ_19_385 TaxID=2769488 RepID=UPI00188E4DE8|nr:TetR/AcrR family transcriptional regulator [Nocardia sp. XZ_19_385]
MAAREDPVVGARERILSAAYELFTRRGIRAVGIDEVIARAGIAKATLYRHFRTKDDLVLAVLERREKLWTFGFIEKQSHLRGETPEQRLLAIFDVFDEWFTTEGFDTCTFVNVLLEMGANHPTGIASIGHLATIRDMVRSRAEEAGLDDPDDFARSWHILMKGSIVSAAEGDRLAARRAQKMGAALIERCRDAAS